MPETFDSIVVIILFLIPGFVASRVLTLAFPRREVAESYLLLEAIALSSLNYGVFSWLLVVAWKGGWHHSVLALAGLAFFVLLLAPVGTGLLLIRVADSSFMKSFRRDFGLAHPVPKAWDHFFRMGKPCWVLATLKDGRVVAGLYGNNSFASSFPAEEDIYLESLCELTAEGTISGLAKSSSGAIIRMENVLLLEFYPVKQGS